MWIGDVGLAQEEMYQAALGVGRGKRMTFEGKIRLAEAKVREEESLRMEFEHQYQIKREQEIESLKILGEHGVGRYTGDLPFWS
ncbi:hypothetical protein KKC52_05195 [bacterium]|nr:hypothetical protein [bacterium]